MSDTTLELLDTYVGMPGTMQGGYVAGLAAGDSEGPVRVRIRKALHPGESLVRTVEEGRTLVLREEELVMTATPGPLHVAARSPIPREDIDAAMGRPLGWDPPYPTCIGCGHEVDGLGVRIRPLGDGKHVVAVWSPAPQWADPDGVIPREFIWTAFDCVTAYVLFVDPPTISGGGAVTGNIAAQFFGEVRIGETYTFQSWRERDDEKSIICGGALYGPSGLVATADQELIRTKDWGFEVPAEPLAT
ncbi:MAG: hotdog fold domain-containing protein [Actinomycetota bacterium]|nr:hotdog fold domain-containing protein [Actinomycetota bacterium]MED5361858.1 hotdog fold domain-containing protein [Actinomycetota bacterium]